MKNYGMNMVIIGIIVAIGILVFAPNVAQIPWWPTKTKIKYGLDIQGGLYLVMGVDTPGVLKETANRLASSIMEGAAEKGIGVVSAQRQPDDVGQGLRVEIKYNSPQDEAALKDYLEKNYGTVLNILSSDSQSMVVKYSDAYLSDLKKNIIGQSIETIRNRIDEFGVSEPSIVAQGDERILIQLPGLQDAQRAKELINRTAKLEFRLVETELNATQLEQIVAEAEKAHNLNLKEMKYSEYVRRLNEAIKDKLPPNTVVLFGKNENAVDMESGKVPYLLSADVPLSGDSLKDAFVNIKQEFNEPYVGLTFNPVGAEKFANLTGANVNRQLAIVLDSTVYSAPSIRQKISGGSAEITLGGGRSRQAVMEEAKTISMALRAGALPASLEQLEERTVGPSLGLDSVAKGKMASYIALAMVMLFMIVYYKGLGVIAGLSLMLNVFFMLCMLTMLNATLTLPGIAGIALTIGISVDANIIIFERIREEVRNGASYRTAIEMGFDKAFSAIFDGSLCSAATSVILMHYGTGPVKGFAVTLLIGLATSLFCAVYVTRTLIELFTNKFNLKFQV